MKLLKFLYEFNEIKVKKLMLVFSNIPGSSPESIAKYIVDTMKSVGLKKESDNITYITGPMTNLPDFNWATFIFAEKYLDGNVFNPAKPWVYN